MVLEQPLGAMILHLLELSLVKVLSPHKLCP
jgi:hypothetical protein